MSEVLKEVGKGVIVLANMMMVIIFFKHYQEIGNIVDVYYGISFGFSFYLFGSFFILIGKDLEDWKGFEMTLFLQIGTAVGLIGSLILFIIHLSLKKNSLKIKNSPNPLTLLPYRAI